MTWYIKVRGAEERKEHVKALVGLGGLMILLFGFSKIGGVFK